MPLTVHEAGGIAVAWNEADAHEIERELRKLDPDLFLDKEYEPHGPHGGYVYWVVKDFIGSGHPPVPCVEWRDTDGPFPLSYALVDRVRRQERKTEGIALAAARENEQIKERARQNTRDTQDDILKDHVRMSRSKHYSVWNRKEHRESMRRKD